MTTQGIDSYFRSGGSQKYFKPSKTSKCMLKISQDITSKLYAMTKAVSTFQMNSSNLKKKVCGITWQHTIRNFPQQNGIAERANRWNSERITVMLNEVGLPKIFWGECLVALVHIWNRCPTKTMGGTTPYQLWHG